ncbi:MAG: prephenate dehydrogenase/arogenate dehydrogenase family protein [Candidatus Melainabacteria bacterium]|nr:prephenate dehydrogenase/arogenate dehydrogenase family protein [Candidatus Melainabacteria bacterium]
MLKENKTKCIAIIGLGLIGGSLAKALKGKGYTVIGITRNPKTIKLAKKEKAIDIGSTKPDSKVLKKADVIFIATPLRFIPDYIKKIAALKLKKEVIVTDVGSTKVKICKIAKQYFLPSRRFAVSPARFFIGGHPMAGTEHAGFSASKKDLFKNCTWILTPTDKNKKLIKGIKKIITRIHAKPIITTPEKHDKAVALISHFPLLVSIGLCQLVKNTNDKKLKKLAMTIASSGFRDTTRIAGGNPEMSLGLLTSNSNELVQLLPRYFKELKKALKLATLKNLKSIQEWRNSLFIS